MTITLRRRGDKPGHPFRGNGYTARGQLTTGRVYQAVVRCWAEHGRPPGLRELARALGQQSPATLYPYLDKLEAEGRVEREPARMGRLSAVWPAGLRGKIKETAAGWVG